MDLNIELLIGALTLGLTSSFLHCAGMCGPVQLLLRKSGLVGGISFHTGRLLGYAILGMIGGSLLSGILSPLKGDLGWALKIAMVVIYFIASGVLWFGMEHIERLLGPYFPSQKISALLSSGKFYQLLPAGLLMALLPCPSITGALVFVILKSNHPIEGGLAMLVFALGTLPSLFIIQGLGALKWLKRSNFALKAMALYFLGSGLFQSYMMIVHQRPCCH